MDEVRQILHLAAQNRKNGRVFRASMLSRQESPSTSSSSSSSSSLRVESKYVRVAEKHRLREELAQLKRQVRNQRRIRKDIEERVRQRIRHAKMTKMAIHARSRGCVPSMSNVNAPETDAEKTLRASSTKPCMSPHSIMVTSSLPSLMAQKQKPLALLPPIKRPETGNDSDTTVHWKTSRGSPSRVSDASHSNMKSASMPHIPCL